MAQVELTLVAVADLDRLIAGLTLPAHTRERVRFSLQPLREFPRLGTELTGRWHGLRFLTGPWRWMLLVYGYHPDTDRVVILTVQDARSSSAATSAWPDPRHQVLVHLRAARNREYTRPVLV